MILDAIVKPVLGTSKEGLTLSDFSDIANVIIAIVNLVLACYIFFYQRSKDFKADQEQAKIYSRTIKLQWFKELVVQPNMIKIENFYSKLHDFEVPLSAKSIIDPVRYSISAQIKAEASQIRVSFVDTLSSVNPTLHLSVKRNVDQLIDDITNAIFDDNIDLSNKDVLDATIKNRIIYSRNDLIRQIFAYQGD